MLTHETNVNERGYVLVTSLVLLSILTIIGVASTYKSVVSIKVSALSADNAKSLEAANAGLNHLFWYWNQSGGTTGENGYEELLAMANDISTGSAGTTASAPTAVMQDGSTALSMTPALVRDMYGESLSELDGKAVTLGAVADLDAFIAAGNNIRVYQYQYAGSVVTGMTVVNNSGWGQGNVPQVAVWVTSYVPQSASDAYPYNNANASVVKCATCNLVVYAVGRSGASRHLIRETEGLVTDSQQLSGVSAMTNAPPYGSFTEQCNAVSTGGTGSGSINSAWPSTNATLNNTVIDATQAPYVRNLTDIYSSPSGTAIKSNTQLGRGSKGFRNGTGSTTGAAFTHTPHIVYSGHGVAAADVKVEAALADGALDNTTPYDNLPGGGEMPHHLVNHSTFGTKDEIKYFAKGQDQLFNLDAYRWAAEQFVCQDTTKADGTFGNGRYCSKAEALRGVVSAMWNDAALPNPAPANVPISGRLTVAEFEYNINYGIPMFGVVRVMMPTTDSGTSTTCNVNGASKTINLYNISGSVATMTTTGKKDGSVAGQLGQYNSTGAGGVDSDGTLDSTARVLVYGALFFDYFTDNGTGSDGSGVSYAGNNLFDPAAGERLLVPLESMDSYMKIEFPILVNPSMPRGTLIGVPTVASLTNALVSGADLTTANRVNMDTLGADRTLMSPYDGFFPISEGILQQTDSDTYINGLAGTMRLMGNGIAGTPAGLSSYTNTIAGTPHIIPSAAGSAFSANVVALKYYYDLMYAGAKQSDAFSWPIASFPATLTSNFYIGLEDSVVGNNQGDSFHLLFPSAYMHGWKVALSALNINASEWNSLLTGISTGGTNSLDSQHAIAKNYGTAGMLKGSPFNVTADAGFADASNLEGKQSKFFFVTPDPTTGYGVVDEKWADIPGEMYVGGLLDMHAHANINGVVYTPGPLEWEPGNSGYSGSNKHFAYINGAIITGFGAFVKNEISNGRYVLVYDNGSVDNATILSNGMSVSMRRFGWQSLN